MNTIVKINERASSEPLFSADHFIKRDAANSLQTDNTNEEMLG